MATDATEALPEIAARIQIVRGHRVMLDADLALVYGVPTKRLNEAMKRNAERFPDDFAFPLTDHELLRLRSQFATSNVGRGGRRYRPYAFTEHGAIMAATVLNSPRAVQMALYVVRAFVRMRSALEGNTQLARKLDVLEKSFAVLDADTRRQFRELRAVVFSLATPPSREQ